MSQRPLDGAATAPPFTEPVTIVCVFLTGMSFETTEQSLRAVGWVDLPHLASSETRERRIQVRFAMTNAVGRRMHDALGAALEQEP